jgi:hypothetical protein
VKAYFAKQYQQMKYDQDLIPILEARIAELELSLWAKFKRWFNKGGSMGLRQTFTVKQEPVMLTGEQLAEVLRNIERKNAATARVIAAPPEFAAKYGEQAGVEVKEGESLSVKLPLARQGGGGGGSGR